MRRRGAPGVIAIATSLVLVLSVSAHGQSAPDTVRARSAEPRGENATSPAGTSREAKAPSISPTGALLRSFVVPGWGQLRTGHPIKAGVFLAGVAGLALSATIENKWVKDDTEKAKKALTDEEFNRIVAERQGHIDSRDRFVQWTVLLWLYNALDAYIEGHFVDFEGLEFVPGGRLPGDAGFLSSTGSPDRGERIPLLLVRRAF
jgi:hypothetical protein